MAWVPSVNLLSYDLHSACFLSRGIGFRQSLTTLPFLLTSLSTAQHLSNLNLPTFVTLDVPAAPSLQKRID